jgi:endonuclease YncB( thermonuclease family)
MQQAGIKTCFAVFTVSVACLAAANLGASEVVMSGQVMQVKDGDSIVLRVGNESYELRLADIDAPEYDQRWGKRARKTLQRKIERKTVEVSVLDIDSYGRLVADVRYAGKSIGGQMVAEGHAWAYRDYLHKQELLVVEAQARAAGLGLWAKPGAVAPWLYRRGERKATDVNALKSKRWNRSSESQGKFADGFSCGTKTYCSQMLSCSEARFYMTQCGLTRLDGDRDSVPCERLCR